MGPGSMKAASLWQGIGAFGLSLLAFGGHIAGAEVVDQALPVSPVMVGAVIVLCAVAIRPRGCPVSWGQVGGVLFLYMAAVAPALIYTRDTQYATEKMWQMLTLVPLCICAGMVILSFAQARRYFLVATVLLGVSAGVLAMLFRDPVAAESRRLSLDGGNTIGIGRALAAATLIVLCSALYRRRGRFLCLALAVGLLGAALAVAARGPLVSLVLAMCVVLVLYRRQLLRWLAVFGAMGGVAWYWVSLNGFFSERLLLSDDNSTQMRVALLRAAFESGFSVVGRGFGHYEQTFAVGGFSGYLYPHNIFVETIGEMGWIGGAFMAALIVPALRRQVRRTRTLNESALFGLAMFLLCSAAVSGDLPSHRGLWVLVGAFAIPAVVTATSSSRLISGGSSVSIRTTEASGSPCRGRRAVKVIK